MLDTNMVSYTVRGRSRAAGQRLLSLGSTEAACISAITAAEIHFGLSKRPQAAALHTLMGGFLASIRVLPFGMAEATAYGRVRAALELNGKSLGNLDLLIAAHAVAVGAIVVTADKGFRHIDGLRAAVNWATDL
jgi:tRNA(fMet)-specific endonuclease VapC